MRTHVLWPGAEAKHCDRRHMDPAAGNSVVPESGGWQGPGCSGCSFLSSSTPLCQPEETGLQLRVWVTLAPSLPPRRTLVSLPKVVLQVNCADKRTSGLVPSWPQQGPCDLASALCVWRGFPASDKGPQPPALAQLRASPLCVDGYHCVE